MPSYQPLARILILGKEAKTYCHMEFSPCIMSVQYTGGCAVHRGMFSTPGVIMSTVRGYHEYSGGCSVHQGVIMSTVGDTMSTLGDVQYTGGYHEYTRGLP